MKSDEIISRINYLDGERLDIERGIKNAPDYELLRWQFRRKIRNERTIAAMYELLGAVKYEVA
jgi:hypothetical protein